MAESGGDGDRLRRIELLADADLAELDVPTLLTEMLDRVRDLLDVDTAVVLLMNRAGTELEATAAAGLEEEVRQGVRVPVNRGFAGRVAAERRPVVLDRVDPHTVINPLLWEKGLRSLLGVPLICTGELVGVLHVGSLRQRVFDDTDIHMLQLAADRLAAAIRLRQSTADRAAAAALQRSLLPATLPALPGLDLAARYVPDPHDGVGGDWYDVFTLDSGHLCLVMGDVVGHGLNAAVVMGRLRSALRAYALETDDPAEVVTRLDRKIQHFEGEITATLVYVVVDPTLDRFQISVAGHPVPVLSVGGRAALLDVPVDLPVGVIPDAVRRTSTVCLTEDAVLCLYTDGLVERRDQTVAAGQAALRDAIVSEPARMVCAHVMAALIGHGGGVEDDVAVLVLCRTD
ncbi:MAG TPA: GAF domain-containing SpoIIE family protein phosphatase [Actinocatenispora sp.]